MAGIISSPELTAASALACRFSFGGNTETRDGQGVTWELEGSDPFPT